MGWWILLGILILFVLIGAVWIRITVIYDDEVTVRVRVLFLNLQIVPGKKKKIRLKDYRIKRFRKMRLKQRAAERAKARKAAEKKKAKEAKKQAKKEAREAAKKAGKEQKKSLRQIYADLKGKVDFGLDIVKCVAAPLVKRFYRSLRVDVYRICLTIATGDAASTAQTYGIACAAVSDLLELLGQTMHLTYKKDAVVRVTPDFLSEQSQIDLHICFRLRIRHILALPFGAVVDFIKYFIKRP